MTNALTYCPRAKTECGKKQCLDVSCWVEILRMIDKKLPCSSMLIWVYSIFFFTSSYCYFVSVSCTHLTRVYFFVSKPFYIHFSSAAADKSVTVCGSSRRQRTSRIFLLRLGHHGWPTPAVVMWLGTKHMAGPSSSEAYSFVCLH